MATPKAELANLPKRRPLKLTPWEVFMPLCCSKRNKDTFEKIEEYIRTKLSLDYMLRESDEFDRVKMYLFNTNELYVFDNIDRVKSRVLNHHLKDHLFDMERFKHSYQQILNNQKLFDILV
jgi:hypothetical protein